MAGHSSGNDGPARRRWLVIGAAALLAPAVLVACSSSPSASPPSTGSTAAPAAPSSSLPYLMISPGHLNALKSGGLTSTLANYFFDSSKTIIILGANGKNATASKVASARKAFPHAAIDLLFNSFGNNAKTGAVGVEGYVGGGQVPPGVTYIQYDPEVPANGTPADEYQALDAGNLTYAQQAAALIHAHHLKYIFSPSTDAGMTKQQGGANRYRTWLAQDRGEWAKTSGADIYAIQTQQIEGTASFDSFTKAAVDQARADAPGVMIFVGIGINPHDPSTTISTQDIVSAYQYSKTVGADGFWNNVETHQGANVSPSVYVDFFKQIYDAKTS